MLQTGTVYPQVLVEVMFLCARERHSSLGAFQLIFQYYPGTSKAKLWVYPAYDRIQLQLIGIQSFLVARVQNLIQMIHHLCNLVEVCINLDWLLVLAAKLTNGYGLSIIFIKSSGPRDYGFSFHGLNLFHVRDALKAALWNRASQFTQKCIARDEGRTHGSDQSK